MSSASFIDELAAHGPEPTAERAAGWAESRDYCRRLARQHYENFTVASWLLPRALRPHFFHIYAYCRWADDLADETADAARSLALLDWWEAQLRECYAGRPRHPVFVALAETIAEFSIPIEPFQALLVAFRQDQSIREYETFDALTGYCRHSADPVGRLVLYLGRCHDAPNVALSDRICTGLQLANFWQDVARDYDRGRVYLPRESRQRFGYDDAMLAARETNEPFRQLMAFEVNRAETWLRDGLPLVDRVPRVLSSDVWLFVSGGLKILDQIRRIQFDVWRQRPEVSKLARAGLLLRCLGRRLSWRHDRAGARDFGQRSTGGRRA